MRDSLLPAALALLVLCLQISPGHAQQASAADDEPWVASCSENGRLVHRERMTRAQAEARQASIVQRYPSATCVFIAQHGDPNYVEPLSQDVVSLPPGTPIDDTSLDAALRAIMGEQVDLVVPASTPPVQSFDALPMAQPTATPSLASLPEPDLASPPQYEAQPGWVRLSTYRTASISDALDDWQRLLDAYPLAGRYIPSTLATDDGYVMLSAGPVSDTDLEEFCVAAQSMQMECDPAGAETRNEGYDYLSHLFPQVFPGDGTCVQAPITTTNVVLPNRDAGRSCWRSPALVPASMPMPYEARRTATNEYPPLPRKRPDFTTASASELASAE